MLSTETWSQGAWALLPTGASVAIGVVIWLVVLVERVARSWMKRCDGSTPAAQGCERRGRRHECERLR